MAGQRPDFEVKVSKRVPQGEKRYSTRVGSAWRNKAGGINVKLDPGIAVLGGETVDITLWPPYEEDGQRHRSTGSGGGQELTNAIKDEFGDDDVPF
jgi:hypothetical protein